MKHPSPTAVHSLFCLFFLSSFFLLPETHAQDIGRRDIPADSTAPSRPLTNAILVYTNSPGADSRFYNGTVYPGYDRHVQGHPFFISDSLQAGSVCYDDILYPEIMLSYDLEKGMVIMPDKRKTLNLRLLPDKIRYFTIAHRRFLNLVPDSNTANAPAAGFYEELYSGKATALASHQKLVQSVNGTDERYLRYHQYDFYYIVIKGRYYPVHNNRGLLDAFGTGKADVRTFLRKNRISFGKDPEQALTKAAEYYSQLKN
jgi:hypothetical protein